MDPSPSFPLSALQHYAFCPRQCALIHVERLWSENVFTAEGRVFHERAHGGPDESRGDLRVARGLPLQSSALGCHGVADVVEFHRRADERWQAFPVEYKRGRPKHEPIDAVQLCAQAICLEEMLGAPVPEGALFYGEVRRRHDVAFDPALREETWRLAREIRALLEAAITPPPVYEKRCHACSLFELCRPRAITSSASRYLSGLIESG